LTKNYLALQVGGDAVGQLLTHHKQFKNAKKPKKKSQSRMDQTANNFSKGKGQ
jgi:hypothetical protein